MTFIPDEDWNNYKEIIDSVHDDFNQAVITLQSKVRRTSRYMEDTNSESNYTPMELKCLVQYNVFRTWPMTKETDSGALDTESITVYFNNTYLSSIDMLSDDGNLKFDPGQDHFVFMGQKYRASGETPISQAKDRALHTIIILKRLTINTSEDKY